MSFDETRKGSYYLERKRDKEYEYWDIENIIKESDDNKPDSSSNNESDNNNPDNSSNNESNREIEPNDQKENSEIESIDGNDVQDNAGNMNNQNENKIQGGETVRKGRPKRLNIS